MKKKFLITSIISAILLIGIVGVYFYLKVKTDKDIIIVNNQQYTENDIITDNNFVADKPAGKAENVKYAIFSSADFWKLDSTEILKPNAALLITDKKEMRKTQELFLAERAAYLECGYHYQISFWYDTDSLYDLITMNKECEIWGYKPNEADKCLSYYIKQIQTKPTHYIYVIELSKSLTIKQIKEIFKDSGLKIFLYKPQKNIDNVTIHLLDTSSDIETVSKKLQKYQIVKNVSEYASKN